MEKYILGENIIITTPQRYEKTFKTLGYIPYKEPQLNKAKKNDEEIKPIEKRKRKED